MIWNNSTFDVLYYSRDAADMDWACVVKIDDERIVVEYDNDGLCQYVGVNDGSGHFELSMEGEDGRATLHRFQDAKLLEGSWTENGERGMWRIHLG